MPSQLKLREIAIFSRYAIYCIHTPSNCTVGGVLTALPLLNNKRFIIVKLIFIILKETT